jgi:hypothetical protein
MTKEGNEAKECDIFVSYSHKDSKEIVQLLVEELEALGLDVWHDGEEITLGDSISESIDEGLRKSDFGAVVVSRNYFDGTSRWELNGLINRHTSEGEVILPLLHKVSFDEVRRRSPSLGDLHAEELKPDNIQSVAKKIYAEVQESDNSNFEWGEKREDEEVSLPSFTSIEFEYQGKINLDKGEEIQILSWENHNPPDLSSLRASEIRDGQDVEHRSETAGSTTTKRTIEETLTGIVTDLDYTQRGQTTFTLRVDESQLDDLPNDRRDYESVI